ncbi:MAG TPA: erythromycin esterase family protein, partial [Candidatus Solibacter sp.]
MLNLRVLIGACVLPCWMAAQTTAQPAVNQWIRAAAIPLATPVAGHGFDDMQPLKKVVGDARIVSLGEATHGSREFFQLKHRMVEFLATQMGFTIFSIEANMPEAYKLNDFVLNGNGDPAKLIKGMYFWTWDTQEVLDMVLWMREFNKSGKGRIEFTGFDMQTPTVALQIVRDAVAKSDPEYAAELESSRKLALAPVKTPQAGFGTAVGTFPLAPVLGKKIKFSGYIKTDKVTGYAGLWWRADVDKSVGAFNNMQQLDIKGTTDWTPYSFELDIPGGATNINFGALMAGDGTAWFDDLKVEIDGAAYRGDEFDFSFESPSLKGLYAGNPAYNGRLVRDVFHSGQQSFRLSHTATSVNPNAVDPKLAAAEWQKVVDHLSAAPKPDAWVVQNARVVLQCMQMRANQVSRDASMAANVKWILDQNPKAKIVLWAHNGHVGTTTGSMGTELRRMYGDQMVIFGFSFNQGGFQAVQQGGTEGLKDFTVPPNRAGSLDATLAASGIPLFALDLRAAPKTGPAAEWLTVAHGTRSIGAVYPEDSPFQFIASQVAPATYNALLFVEKTTPARPNTPRMPPIEYKTGPADDSGAIDYRDPEFAVSVKLPKDWKIGRAFRWGDNETTVPLLAPENAEAGSLYFRMAPNPAQSEEETRKLLLTYPASKAASRVTAGLADYHLRPDSLQPRTVSGRPALSCIGEFTQN